MLGMLTDAGIGLVFVVAAVLLVFIGMPKHGKQPRFMRFEAVMMLYPASVLVCMALGVGLMFRAYSVG